MKTHVIFDVDGTLVDSRRANRRMLCRLVLEMEGRHLTDADADACFGLADPEALEQLGVRDVEAGIRRWGELVAQSRPEDYELYPGVRALIQSLAAAGCELGIVTSKSRTEYGATFSPTGLGAYFGLVVCSDDTVRHKPDGEPLQFYLERTGADPARCLYIGDTGYDMACAAAAGIDGALALWGNPAAESASPPAAAATGHAAVYRLRKPADALPLVGARREAGSRGLQRLVEMQMLVQAGLAYSRDPFDIDRFQTLRRLAAEMLADGGGLPLEQVETLFCGGEGYPTPKLDSRAAIFDEQGRILLVREKSDGTWSLPGGWVDANLSVADNLVKEVREEAGLDVLPGKLVALLDRNRHNRPLFACGIAKAFMICHVTGGQFAPNIEISECGYFPPDGLPELSVSRNTREQIAMCFLAEGDPCWQTICD